MVRLEIRRVKREEAKPEESFERKLRNYEDNYEEY